MRPLGVCVDLDGCLEYCAQDRCWAEESLQFPGSQASCFAMMALEAGFKGPYIFLFGKINGSFVAT